MKRNDREKISYGPGPWTFVISTDCKWSNLWLHFHVQQLCSVSHSQDAHDFLLQCKHTTIDLSKPGLEYWLKTHFLPTSPLSDLDTEHSFVINFCTDQPKVNTMKLISFHSTSACAFCLDITLNWTLTYTFVGREATSSQVISPPGENNLFIYTSGARSKRKACRDISQCTGNLTFTSFIQDTQPKPPVHDNLKKTRVYGFRAKEMTSSWYSADRFCRTRNASLLSMESPAHMSLINFQ